MKLLKIEEIPWSKIVHVYGRATKYPTYLNWLENGSAHQKEFAINELRRTLTHQGCFLQATPIVLPFLFELIKNAKPDTPTFKLLNLINDVLDVLLFQQEFKPISFDNKKTIESLLSENYLWDEFISEEQDEILWEDYDYQIDLHVSVTAQYFIENKKSIFELPTSGKKMSKIKNLKQKVVDKIEFLESKISY